MEKTSMKHSVRLSDNHSYQNLINRRIMKYPRSTPIIRKTNDLWGT